MTKITPAVPSKGSTKVTPRVPFKDSTKVNPRVPSKGSTKVTPRVPSKDSTKVTTEVLTKVMTKVSTTYPIMNIRFRPQGVRQPIVYYPGRSSEWSLAKGGVSSILDDPR